MSSLLIPREEHLRWMVVVVAVGAKADTPVIDSVARRKDLMVAFVLSVKNECDVCCLRSKGINLNI